MKVSRSILAALLLSVVTFAAAQVANLSGQILASALQTGATVNTADQTNNAWSRAHIILNVSSYGSGSYTPTVQGKDPVSGNYYTVLSGSVLNSTATTVLRVGPAFTTGSNVANDILPRTWRVSLAGASTPSMTLSIGVVLEQ